MIPEKECDALIETVRRSVVQASLTFQYVPVIIRWIDQKETPEVLCAQFHLCPPVTVSKVDECGLCKVVLKGRNSTHNSSSLILYQPLRSTLLKTVLKLRLKTSSRSFAVGGGIRTVYWVLGMS